MKKLLKLLTICTFILICTTGCFESDKLEGSTITTTVYPVEYLVTRLYGEHSTINSIYPNDTNVTEYNLTPKQIKDYSNETTLFVYNGIRD